MKSVAALASTSPGQWTWAGGPDRIAERELFGTYGTKGLAAPGNVPGARYGAATWRDASGNLWLFGGYGMATSLTHGKLNDLWKWNGAAWTWVNGSNATEDPGHHGTKGVAAPENCPGARFNSVSWTDADGIFWLFGGYSGSASLVYGHAFSDLWKWDGTSWTWVNGPDTGDVSGTYGTRGVGAAGNWPGGRHGASGWRDAGGGVWLFGGDGYAASIRGELSDLWKWDGSTWTWVNGPDTPNQSGVYGEKGTASPTNVPGGRYGAAVWPGADGKVRILGGSGHAATGEGLLNDLWVWDGTNWTWISGSDSANAAGVYGTKGIPAATNVPGGRRQAAAWSDASGNLFLLGGWGQPASGADASLNDVWRFDGTNWTWVGGADLGGQPGTYGTKGTPSAANEPGARFGGAKWTAQPGEVWIFGGDGASSTGMIGPLNDLWHSDGNWTWMSGSDGASLAGVYGTKGIPSLANVPGARTGSGTWRTANGDVWLFGGTGYSARGIGALNDLWRWDGAAWTWISGSDKEDQPGVYGTKGVPAPGNVPGPRFGAVSSVDPAGNLWLYGGWQYKPTPGTLNDLWKWDGSNWTWVSGSSAPYDLGHWGTMGVPDPANAPRSRRNPVAWTDPAGHFWILGGYGAADRRDQDDMWRWDGTNWTWMFGGGQYITSLARRSAASWVDANGHFWLFGGYRQENIGGALNDFWRWDGTTWQKMGGSWGYGANGVYGTRGIAAPGNFPGARSGAASWTDSRGDVWLFGGGGHAANSKGALNDLWRWDGTNWTWMRGADAPSSAGVYGDIGVPAPGNDPGGRSTSIFWVDPGGRLWLVGDNGLDSAGVSGRLQDRWVYEPPDCTPPSAVIDAPGSILEGSGAHGASVADAGAGATYEWTIAGGSIESGLGTPVITFSATPGATSVILGVTVRQGDCVTVSTEKEVLVGVYHALDVVRNGSGSSWVYSVPAGISCEADCTSIFAAGSSVTLTTSVANPYRFAGWTGGGCTGTGDCTITMDGPKTVAATFLPAAAASFNTVTPCRVVDTRNAPSPWGDVPGPWSAPALTAGASRAFTIGGACGVPADAAAVALNVTVTAPTEGGSLTLHPGTGPAPETTTIHFPAGRTRANNVTMGLVGGVLSVLDRQQTGTVELIIDVSGYYR